MVDGLQVLLAEIWLLMVCFAEHCLRVDSEFILAMQFDSKSGKHGFDVMFILKRMQQVYRVNQNKLYMPF